MGRWIGALLGYFFLGGFFGAMLGYFVGGMFNLGLQNNLRHSYSLHAQGSEIFFSTFFLLMGHIAKADGRVSEEEVDQVESLMSKMGIRGDKREEAISYFRKGTTADFDFSATLQKFLAAARFRADLKRNLIILLLDIAMADGSLHRAEEDVLRRVAVELQMDMRRFEETLTMLGAQQAFSSSQGRPLAEELALAYRALGVDSGIDDRELKRAYRKLMSQYHPDKMIAKGVPEEMLSLATEKAQEIQAAYDLIERSRKR